MLKFQLIFLLRNHNIYFKFVYKVQLLHYFSKSKSSSRFSGLWFRFITCPAFAGRLEFELSSSNSRLYGHTIYPQVLITLLKVVLEKGYVVPPGTNTQLMPGRPQVVNTGHHFASQDFEWLLSGLLQTESDR